MESFLNGRVTLYRGDCLEILPELEENSIDSVCCDPPYHLTSIVKRFGKCSENDFAVARANLHRRTSSGFMGKQWDGGDIAFRPETWAEVLRVLKPGGHLLAMGGDRTYHRLATAIEDAGFEIRGALAYLYGSGFPKSLDVSKAIDRAAGAEREIIGKKGGRYTSPKQDFRGGKHHAASGVGVAMFDEVTAPATDAAREWQGWGTALKPAMELIVLVRKPLSESSIAANVLKWGTGAINVDGCRVAAAEGDYDHPGNSGIEDNCRVYGKFQNKNQAKPNSNGRWPANLIHDGSEEVLAGFPDVRDGGSKDSRGNTHVAFSMDSPRHATRDDAVGSAARFFYTAKADAYDRLGSRHPTVKPLDLMQYLVRLVTPNGGVVLDPFAGTGTTGEAAFRESFKAVLIEREPEYQADIVKRMGLCLAGRDERNRESIKARGLVADAGPLFGGGGQ